MTTAEPATALDEVLAGAGQVMVGVVTPRGPHVTPELFTVAAGRIWCLTAATTLKARLLSGGGPVAVAATAPDGRSVIAQGRGVVLDAAHPLRNLRHLDATLASPLAVGQFALHNAAELTGAVIDLFAGKLGRAVPPRRVVLCVEPLATAVLDGDEVVRARGWGAPGNAAGTAIPPADGDLDLVEAVPKRLREFAADGPAFLGWATKAGLPLVLPAQWEAETCRAVVAGSLLAVAGGLTASRASVTRDGWTGFGPSGKQGLMLRGGGVASTEGGTTIVSLDVDGVAYWNGIDTGQVRDDSA